LTAPPTPDSRPTNGDHEAWKCEQESFWNINELVLLSIEAIAFLSILIDFKISNIAKLMSGHDILELKQMTFETLVVTPKGKDIAKSLMTALVNTQINNELGVESVIDSLKQRCPSICESNDVVLYQGLEQLRNARSFSSQTSASNSLQEALRLFLSISKNIQMDKINEIVEIFKSFRFWNGIVDLALARARDFRNEVLNQKEPVLVFNIDF
jgi:nuclear pore complex protein Nup155